MTTVSAPTPTKYTPADVARLSDEHGKLYELVGGTLVEKPAMSLLSNWIAGRVAFFLQQAYPPEKAYVVPEQITHCFDDIDLMRRPDVALVWSHRLPNGLTHGELGIPPDLVVEVISPSNKWSEVRSRIDKFLEAGVPIVWVVEPDPRSMHVYRRDGSVSLLRANELLKDEPLLPGLILRVGEIFPAAVQRAQGGP